MAGPGHVQLHGRLIDLSRLVNVLYKPCVGLQHEVRGHGLRIGGVAHGNLGRVLYLHRVIDRAQPRVGVEVLVGVVVAGYLESLVVGGQGKFGELGGHHKTAERQLPWKLVAKAHPVGKHPKHHVEPAAGWRRYTVNCW